LIIRRAQHVGFRLKSDAKLRLVVEGPLDGAGIEIDKHTSKLLAYCKDGNRATHNGQSSPAVLASRLVVSTRDTAIDAKRTPTPSGAAAG